MSVTIYILELEHKKWYVGKTRATLPETRILQHFRGRGSAWTSLHPPRRVLATHPHCSDFDEDKYTKELMAEKGIDNVRGGTYCQVTLSAEQRRLLEKEILGAQDRCYRCGQAGHFARFCPGRTGTEVKAKRPSKKRQACSRCGGHGHNKRTCKSHATQCASSCTLC